MATARIRSPLSRRDWPDKALFARWQTGGDQAACAELISRHLPLARNLARRYARPQEPFEDLLQVAMLGLFKAIDRFDPCRAVAFSSYAVPMILGELKHHFRDRGYPVHLPRGLQELVREVQAAKKALSSRTGSSPSQSEIADYLGVGVDQVIEALDAIETRRAASLDATLSRGPAGETSTGYETVGIEEEGYALVETALSLAAARNRLMPQDRRVFELRFKDGLTQQEIAQRIGVSQMQVSRMLRRAANRLSEELDVQFAAKPASSVLLGVDA